MEKVVSTKSVDYSTGINRLPSFLKIHFDEGADAGAAPVDSSAAPAESAETPAAGGKPAKDDSKAFGIRLSQEKAKIEESFAPMQAIIEHQAKMANMSVEDYLTYAASEQEKEALEAEAEKTGKTPEVIKAEKEAQQYKSELDKYKQAESLSAEEAKLTEDPEIGSFVSDHLEEMREIAEKAGVDLNTSLAIVAQKHLPELLAAANPETHIKKYLEDVKNGAKPVEIGGGASAGTQPKEPKTFNDAISSARERIKSWA